MKERRHLNKKAQLLAFALGSVLPVLAAAAEDGHQFDAKFRVVYFGDEGRAYPSAATPNPNLLRYEQSALGIEANYKSPFWGNVFGIDASLYGAAKLTDNGTPTTQLVEVGNDGQLENGFLAIGQALIKLKWDETARMKAGYQFHDSLLLKSTNNRAVPDTYSGVNVVVTPLRSVNLYGALYDRFRSRTTNHYEKFRTEAATDDGIDFIGILGASYVSGPVSLTAEYLNAKSYLSKFGIVGTYSLPVRDTTLFLSSGWLTSRDAGSLFVCGAEREMDCTGTGRISNRGSGVYVDAEWRIKNFAIGAAVAKFDGFWIEDNFAVDARRTGVLTQDPGTNPFPTSSTVGADFTNNDETAVAVRLVYDWNEIVPGLRTAFKYVRGTGAHSSNLTNSAQGKERYREFDVRYSVPAVKNLFLRYTYLNYDSHIDGFTPTATIRGFTRQEWKQHRVFVDYVYTF
jgi:hypothetical protein